MPPWITEWLHKRKSISAAWVDSIRSTLKWSLGAESRGVCESCEMAFSSLRLASRRSAQFLSSCTHSISHSWLTSSHLFLSDAIILGDVMQGWLSFWRSYRRSSFLTDTTTNICCLSAELLCRMLHFMVRFLFLVENSLHVKHVNWKFGSSLVFPGWQQEIHPNFVVSILNLSSYRVYHLQAVTHDLLRRFTLPFAG